MLLVLMHVTQITAPLQHTDWVGHTTVCLQHVPGRLIDTDQCYCLGSDQGSAHMTAS